MPGTKIREKRQAAGMTLQDVAKMVGTTAVTVSRWEREPQRVTLPVLANLAQALGCSEAELLGADVPQNVAKSFQNDAEFFGMQPEHFAVVVVVSDVMEPTIMKGDNVYLDTRETVVEGGGLYGIMVGSHVRLFRMHPVGPDNVRLLADNPLYKFDVISQINEIIVIGKVIGYTRKL